MQLESVEPDRVEPPVVAQTAERLTHCKDGLVLGRLVADILTKCSAEGLVPMFPSAVLKPGPTRLNRRKGVFRAYVAELPVKLSRFV